MRRRALAADEPVAAGGLSVQAQADRLVLSVTGPLDAATGGLLKDAVAASGPADSGYVVVDLGGVSAVTTEGLRALVVCAGLAARSALELRFRFGHTKVSDA